MESFIKNSNYKGLKMNLTEDLKEFKYGYHRTNSLEIIDSIINKGFIPGYGDMYGKGLYSCFNLKSQLNYSMTGYGDYILKFELHEKNLLIFNYQVAKKIYGDKYTLIDQLVNQKIVHDKYQLGPEWFKMSKDLENSFDNEFASADVAYNQFVSKIFFTSSKIPKLPISGIMFTGRQDGDVCVVYNPDIAKPVGFCYCGSSLFRNGTPTENDLVWESPKNLSKAAKRSDLTRELYNTFGNKLTKIEVGDDINFDFNVFKQKYPWFMKGVFENLYITLTGSELKINGGNWLRGECAADHIDYGVNFNGGKFIGNQFFGNFNYGHFAGKLFGGYWKKGIWEKGDWRGSIMSRTPAPHFEYKDKQGRYIPSDETPDIFSQNNK